MLQVYPVTEYLMCMHLLFSPKEDRKQLNEWTENVRQSAIFYPTP